VTRRKEVEEMQNPQSALFVAAPQSHCKREFMTVEMTRVRSHYYDYQLIRRSCINYIREIAGRNLYM